MTTNVMLFFKNSHLQIFKYSCMSLKRSSIVLKKILDDAQIIKQFLRLNSPMKRFISHWKVNGTFVSRNATFQTGSVIFGFIHNG